MPQDFTDEDMAAVGRSLMAAIEAHHDDPWMKDWAPADDPAEIVGDLLNALEEATAETTRLRSLINTPIVNDWLEGVRIEVPHQQERWGAEHDAGKTPADWFWLVGYLAGKALHAHVAGDQDKAKHHTISTGATLANWWRSIAGQPGPMRPGIDRPIGEESSTC